MPQALPGGTCDRGWSLRPTYGTLGPMCAPVRAALIEPGQGSTHGRGSPIDDERTPASEPDRTPVSTEHPRGRAAAFLRPPARVSYRRLHRGRDGDLERMVERVPCRASVDMFGLTMDDFVRRCGDHVCRRVLRPRRGGEVIFTFAPTAPSPEPRAPGRERRGGAVA